MNVALAISAARAATTCRTRAAIGRAYLRDVRIHDGRRRATWLMALASFACGACLPLGAPPPGRHELAARDLDGVGFIQPAPGQPATLFARRWPDPYTTPCESHVSIFTLDEAASPDGLATERPLAEHVELPTTGIYPGAGLLQYALPSDARGRVYLATQPPTPPVDGGCPIPATLGRFDVATGARTELGPIVAAYFGGQLSPDRTRVLFNGIAPPGGPIAFQTVVRDLDDHAVTFPVSNAQFVGSDVYALSSSGDLVRLNADGTTTAALMDVGAIEVVPSARGPLLSIYPTYQTNMFALPQRLFDPATATELPLPAKVGDRVILSPSGRYVMVVDARTMGGDPTQVVLTDLGYTLFDRDTGTSERRTWPAGREGVWRPGKGNDEFWLDADTKLLRWIPGQPTLETPMSPSDGSSFTNDGRTWVSYRGGNIDARNADRPDDPPFQLNPPSSHTELGAEVPDGRLIIHVKVGPYGRFDIYLVDPVARMRTPLATSGFVIAAGRTRALAMLKWVMSGGSGDLALLDFETGAITTLAENVYRFAIEPAPEGGDPLAPGLRVAALVRARIASPYDGLWVTTLP
jgi:hypothetical protein